MRGHNYRVSRGMPTTRKEFAPGAPNVRIAKFSSGTARDDYDVKLRLVSTERVQIRHNAIEAARVAAHKRFSELGEDYFLEVKVYPHVILRENKMLATAGADRLQEGMRRAYGKPVSLAARVNRGTAILELSIMNTSLSTAEEAFKTAASKLPAPMKIEKIPLR
ncbi:MAG: 50S ribosomal protein L16 [Nitrososphaerales archaeon]